jgi:hypothetical protein
MNESGTQEKSGKPVATPLCGVSNPTAVADRGLFLRLQRFRHK